MMAATPDERVAAAAATAAASSNKEAMDSKGPPTPPPSKSSSPSHSASTGVAVLLSPNGNQQQQPTPALARLKDEEKRVQLVICELNVQIAFFRDLLIHIGTPKDSAELRERIRRVRRQCVEGCKQTNCQLLPLIKSALYEGTILDSHQLISLYLLSQLLERELDKCQRLVVAIPMDMTAFYETRPNAPAGAVAMLSQIMCPGVPVKPDFNAEEKASIEKDTREMRQIIAEMAECMPKEDPDKARNGLTNAEGGGSCKRKWTFRSKRKQFGGRSFAGGGGGGFCCLCASPSNF